MQIVDRIERKQIGDGFKRVAVCLCSKCGAEKSIVLATRNPSPHPKIVQKNLQEAGWRVTSKRRVCPACQEKEHTPMPGLKAVPPRECTQADRRKIFRELDEHWDEKAGRYFGSATDKTVADKLGVPWKWVADIRDENFGAETNEAADLALAELASLKAEADKHSQEALALATAFETLSARIDKIIGPKKTS